MCRQDDGTRAYRDVFTAGPDKPIPDRVALLAMFLVTRPKAAAHAVIPAKAGIQAGCGFLDTGLRGCEAHSGAG